MSIFRRQPPPPPESFYRRNPIASIGIVLTIIAMFVLGPVGVIYDTMSEELKGKADNNTVILMMKQMKENDDRQWKEIERNRSQEQQVIVKPQMKVLELKLKPIPPGLFESYMKMSPEVRIKYKTYLQSNGYDIKGLP